MGVVYLGRDETSGVLAAVKLIRPERAASQQLRARLRREVMAARRVPRFCTAPVLASDMDANPPWLATEYIDGPTLDTALLERGPMTGAALATFAVGVAFALHAIHQHGVVHRDLKPSNIILSELGPRVIDFGIARLDDADTKLTRSGVVVGTPAYLAPEQLRGEPVTAAVDVFAWAGLVTYAATGRHPFGTGEGAWSGILYHQPDLTSLASPLRELVAAAFDKDPATRLSSADLVARLSTAAPAATTEVLATAATAPPAPPVRPRRWRRRLVLAAAVVTAVAVAASAGAVALLRGVGGDGGGPGGGDEPLSRRLAAESLALSETDQQRAMQRALDAWSAAPTVEARGALLSAYTLPYGGQLGTEPGGVGVAVNPAGTMVAVGYFDGMVRLWDAGTRQPLGEPLTGHREPVYGVSFSPDGSLLATASIESNERSTPIGVRIWEMPSGRLLRVLPGLGVVAWHPDGDSVLATAFRNDGNGGAGPYLVQWDPYTGEELLAIQTGQTVHDAAVSPDGQWVAGGRDNGTAGVWRLDDGGLVTEITGHDEANLVRVAFAGTGELATVGGEGRIELWELPAATRLRTITEGGDRTAGQLTFTADGFLLANGGGSAVQWFEPLTGWQGGELIGYHGTPIDIATSADGRLVAATGIDGPTILWRRATFWLPHPDAVMDVGFAPAGDRLATVSDQGTVRVWDATSGAMTPAGAHAGQGYDVAYTLNGTLVSTAMDGTVRITTPAGAERAVLSVADGYEARELAVSPDGSLLAVGASPADLEGQHVIYVWDAGTMRPYPIIDLGDAIPYAITFTPDGSRLLAAVHSVEVGGNGGGSELRSWRTDGLAAEPPVSLGPDHVVAIAVSPDGGTLALAGSSRTIELRGLAGGAPGTEFGEHPATVREVEFSPDGRTLATITADDGVVRLWDRESGALVAALVGHTGSLNGLDFSPDGRRLASGGPDGFVGLWTVDPDSAIDRLCQAVSHPLCTGSAAGD